MSTPVVTEKWAGDLTCSVCRRKRLPASEFSKAAIERHRKELPEAPMKCKVCVEAAAQQERDVAASKTAASGAAAPAGEGPSEKHECSSCKNALPATAFSRSNLSKGPGKQRCLECLAEAEKANLNSGEAAYREKLAAAKATAAKAEATGSAREKLAASTAPCRKSGPRGYTRHAAGAGAEAGPPPTHMTSCHLPRLRTQARWWPPLRRKG